MKIDSLPPRPKFVPITLREKIIRSAHFLQPVRRPFVKALALVSSSYSQSIAKIREAVTIPDEAIPNEIKKLQQLYATDHKTRLEKEWQDLRKNYKDWATFAGLVTR